MTHASIDDMALCIKGDGLPLLCVHGWTMDRSMWDYQAPLAQRGIQLVTYNRRAHGHRRAAANGFTADLDDIKVIADHFQWDQFALMGMSQGARLAHHFAQECPKRIDHLILQSAPSESDELIGDDAAKIPLQKYAAMIGKGELLDFETEWKSHPLMHCPHPEPRRHILKMLSHYSGDDLLALDPAGGPAPRPAITPAYHGPLLAITGATEPVHIRRYADQLVAVNHQAQSPYTAHRLDIPGHGHFTNMTAPEIVNDAILAFLKDTRNAHVA